MFTVNNPGYSGSSVISLNVTLTGGGSNVAFSPGTIAMKIVSM